MTNEFTEYISRVNVYRDSTGSWYFAAWCGEEFDCTHQIDDAESESEAIAWVKGRWPLATIKRIEDCMTVTRKKLASVDVGESGSPGQRETEVKAIVYKLSTGQYEISGSYSTGTNQGYYYQENYTYGPWRGRGDTLGEARRDFLDSVPSEYSEQMALASKEAIYDAEDKEIADAESK